MKQLVSWAPWIAILLSLIAGWTTLSTRVTALEVRSETERADIQEIKEDVKEIHRLTIKYFTTRR